MRDALLAKAEYLASIGDKDLAVAAFKTTEEKTAGGGNKLDLIFSQIRSVPGERSSSCRPCPQHVRFMKDVPTASDFHTGLV